MTAYLLGAWACYVLLFCWAYLIKRHELPDSGSTKNIENLILYFGVTSKCSKVDRGSPVVTPTPLLTCAESNEGESAYPDDVCEQVALIYLCFLNKS